MKTGGDLLFAFREHLKVLGRSEATVSAYSEHVKEYLETVSNVQSATRRALEGYIAGLYEHRTKVGNPYQPGTIALKVRSLKRFFEYLEKANVIFVNPAEFIREPKQAVTGNLKV